MGRLSLVKRIAYSLPSVAVCSVISLTMGCVALSPAKPPASPGPTAATPAEPPQAAAANQHEPNRASQPIAWPEKTVKAGSQPLAGGASTASRADAVLLGPAIASAAERPQEGADEAEASASDQAAVSESEVPTAPQHETSAEVDGGFDTAVAAPVATQTEAPLPPRYADLWDRIRSGFGLPQLYDPRIAYHERWFASNPQYMERKLSRARLYLYHIVMEVERRGMPMEIALLPAIESAYQPHAYSHARAVGLWQFIGPTARRYGLKINWWYDGRRDVVASTTAALNYLEKLYNDFDGDWHLALAAYNAGEGRIKWAIERNRQRGLPITYPYLRVRAETRHYVPKLMAFVNIVSDPEYYGLRLAPIPNEPYFARVDLGSQIDLNVVARLADVSVGDLFDINPGFRRWATDPNGPHQVLVPVEKKEILVEGLNNLPEEARIKWRRHKVRRGDTLSTIARRHRVSVGAIKKANNLRGTLIHVGQDLMIPISSRPLSRQVANVTRPLPRSSTRPSGRKKITHRVRKGETLWSIARKYRVYVRQLAKWNFMHPRDILRTGQRLKIWVYPNRLPSI